MLEFGLESWAAIAPGLDSRHSWRRWLRDPQPIEEAIGKIDLTAVPAMLRRRFNILGKCAMGAALPLLDDIDAIPALFATRHGDTELTFSLLETLGLGEPVSPTSFSLAVHNAVSGLYTIARRDTSEVNVISAMRGLVLQTLFEAMGQLRERDRLLCVIYDVPLPEFYRQHNGEQDLPFAYAIAMLLSRESGERYVFAQDSNTQVTEAQDADGEQIRLLRLLTGLNEDLYLSQNGVGWRVSKVVDG